MEKLHIPENIKVHFAGAEVSAQFIAATSLGVSYGLYTVYPFIERIMFDKPATPLRPLRNMKNPFVEIPRFNAENLKHCIQDSGLFTLLFGSKSGKHDEAMITKWYDNLVRFTNDHATGVTCIECDCQSILGVEKAWEFRERMKKDLPNNRIINVFHPIDGKYGLDRMIEFSDYIALSVPELRSLGKKNYVSQLTRYIKNKKPTIDIHLLGCTDVKLLNENKFCTSADSTSYLAGRRFGFLDGNHISRINTDKIRNLVDNEVYKKINEYNNELYTNFLILSIEKHKIDYQNAAGNQDYYYMKNIKSL